MACAAASTRMIDGFSEKNTYSKKIEQIRAKVGGITGRAAAYNRLNNSEVKNMTITPVYEKYGCTMSGEEIRAQSIVECRLSDWSENRMLAVSPRVVLSGAEVLSGEVRYGGKLYFSIVAAASDGTLIGAERGAEFSHKAACASAAPAQSADVVLEVEKTDVRYEGRSVILSAIVTAHIRLYVPTQLQYLTGGEGIVCDFRPVRIRRLSACSGTASLEEEFDTDYVGDVLLHSEQVCLTRVSCSAGSLDISGEINLGIFAKREGENEPVSYERLIPFRAEIPCDEASAGMSCVARAEISSVNVTCSCDEEKNRCRILAQIDLDIRGTVSRRDEVPMAADAFAPGYASALTCAPLETEEAVCAFTAAERVSGTAAVAGEVDFSCILQSAALCEAKIAAEVSEGEITAEGVLSALVFYKDAEGAERTVPVSLPFSFPVRCDRARAGDTARISALCCGVSVRQKKEGELEAEGALKLYVTLFSREKYEYVTEMRVGEAELESECAVSVYVPTAGDTLWDTAKKLGKTPEQVQAANPGLTFPLSGGERIVVYRKKENVL